MCELLLVVCLAWVNPSEPPACQARYEIPWPIMAMIQAEREKGGKIIVQAATPTGYISQLFYGKLFLEGWFYPKNGDIIACEVDFAIEVEEGAKPIFIWHKEQR